MVSVNSRCKQVQAGHAAIQQLHSTCKHNVLQHTALCVHIMQPAVAATYNVLQHAVCYLSLQEVVVVASAEARVVDLVAEGVVDLVAEGVVASVAGVEADSEAVEGASWSSSDLYRLPIRSVNSVTVGHMV